MAVARLAAPIRKAIATRSEASYGKAEV